MTKKKDRYRKIGESSNFWTLQSIFSLLILIALPAYCVRTIIYNKVKNAALERGTVKTSALVINERNYYGNSPVSGTFSLSYEFVVKGKKYKGNTRDPDKSVGDKIIVEYVPTNPEYNQVVDYKEPK